MTKKEQAFVEQLQTQLALRFSSAGRIMPDVPLPNDHRQLSTGFMFNSHTKRVDVACSSGVHHAIGRTDRTTTQGPRHLFSTRKLALQAMRREMEVNFAAQLRSIDVMIEAEEEAQ